VNLTSAAGAPRWDGKFSSYDGFDQAYAQGALAA
jgi:hypothetical protein